MQLHHIHDSGGPGRVAVSAPGIPVFIHVNPEAEYRSVHAVVDDGLAAWAGPSGTGGRALGIEVNRPGILSSLKRTFLRGGSYVSGGGTVIAGGDRSIASGGGRGGSVRATGRGAVASGGSITNVVTGDGARIVGMKPEPVLPTGVHITVPPNSSFEIKAAQSVTVRGGQDSFPLDEAEFLGRPWGVALVNDNLVVGV